RAAADASAGARAARGSRREGLPMSARRLLRGGLPRLFDDHRGPLGRLYRLEFERLLREAGPGASEEVRELAADVAELRVRKAVASRAWASLAERRLRGKGRKPTEGRVRSGAKRDRKSVV